MKFWHSNSFAIVTYIIPPHSLKNKMTYDAHVNDSWFFNDIQYDMFTVYLYNYRPYIVVYKFIISNYSKCYH